MNEQIDPVEGQMETEPQGHWEIPKYEGEIPQGPAQVQVDHSMYRTPATVETQVQHQEMPDRYELGLDKESYGPGVVDSWEQSFQRNGYSQQEAKFKADEYAGVVDQVRQAERQEYEEQVREDLQASIRPGLHGERLYPDGGPGACQVRQGRPSEGAPGPARPGHHARADADPP